MRIYEYLYGGADQQIIAELSEKLNSSRVVSEIPAFKQAMGHHHFSLQIVNRRGPFQ